MSEKRRIAVIDAETDPFVVGRVPEPFIWGFYDGEAAVRYFDRTEELVDFLRGQRLCVYAHNGGRFDYHLGFLRHLEAYGGITLINGRLARFTIGECEFRDSVNILPMALKDFRKDDIDYAKLNADVRHRHMPEIKRYLATDCTSLYELVSAFRRDYGDGLTLAGSAMKYWRKMMNHDNVANNDADFFRRFSPFYSGGRVQCFTHGCIDTPFHVVDINSAYPYAMLSDHPFSRSYEAVDSPSRKAKIRDTSMYVVQGKTHRGALPFRSSGRTSYPSDGSAREIHCTGWELAAAIETDSFAIDRIITRYDFPVIDNFTKYINHFYELKKRSKKGSTDYIFAKFMMNALYGKFGANPDNYQSFGIVPTEYALQAEADYGLTLGRHSGEWQAVGTLGPWALMRSELHEDEKFYFNVATAASITGYVRAYLWRHLHQVSRSGGHLLYCDTDSIAFSGSLQSFNISKNLGEWSIDELSPFVSGGIAGKKLYAFKSAKRLPETERWKCASKGVRLSAKEIMKIARGGEVKWENDAPTFSMVKPPVFQKRNVRATH